MAAIAGLLASLAFPPLCLWGLAWVALAPLLLAMAHCHRRRQAAALAYLYGLTTWAACVPWIGVTVVVWTRSAVGWAAWALLCAIQSLWYAAWGGLTWSMCRRGGLNAAFGLAGSWTVMEWARTLGPLAMPWCFLSHTLYGATPLLQAASLGGAGLLTFCIALVNAAALAALHPSENAAFRRAPAIGAPLVVAACTLATGWLIAALMDASPGHSLPAVRITAMQPNVGTNPLGPAEREALRSAIADLATRAARERPLIVAWPESTADDLAGDKEENALFARVARTTKAWQIVGSGGSSADGRPTNSAFALNPRGEVVARYDKRQLVPFGEWTPARSLFAPADRWFRFVEDNAAGTDDRPLDVGGLRVGPLICYESVFPSLVRRSAARGASVLLNLTNDSWAGRSASLEQHLAMTVLRAVEVRRPVVIAGLTGPTACVVSDGRATRIHPHEQGHLTLDVSPRTDTTPYLRWGDTPLLLLCAVLIAAALRPDRRRQRR